MEHKSCSNYNLGLFKVKNDVSPEILVMYLKCEKSCFLETILAQHNHLLFVRAHFFVKKKMRIEKVHFAARVPHLWGKPQSS